MNIDTLFEKYPENIIGFRVNKTTKIIDVWLSNDWEIPTSESKSYAIKKQKEDEANRKSYYIIFSDTLGFEMLYEALSKIIEHNLDNERKQKLFALKINELKKLFTTLSYEELKEIQFDSTSTLTPSLISQNVVDVTEKPQDDTIQTPKVENIDKSEQLMSPEIKEHEIDLDDENVDNVKPIELNLI